MAIRYSTVEFKDMTITPQEYKHGGQFIVKHDWETTSRLLFPEAARSLDAAVELQEVLTDMQEKSHDFNYIPSLDKLRWFGIQKDAEGVVEQIINCYVDVCRDTRAQGLEFSPGVQYNCVGVTPHGINTTYGNYGLFAATLLTGTEEQSFKRYLMEEGEKLLGNHLGFIQNIPGTAVAVETLNGVLYIQRGPTAQYPHMLQTLATGHISPLEHVESSNGFVTVQKQVEHQIASEIGPEALPLLRHIRSNGIAYSQGSAINGTGKIEVLASAELFMTANQVAETLVTSAEKKWETQRLFVMDNPSEVFMKTLQNETTNPKGLHEIDLLSLRLEHAQESGEWQRILDETAQSPHGIRTSKDSKSLWVPTGLASILMHEAQKGELVLPPQYGFKKLD